MAGFAEYDQVNLTSPMGASHHKQHASQSQEVPTSDELPSASSPADASDSPADASETILQNPVRVTILTAGFLLPILTELIMHMVHGNEWEEKNLFMATCWHMGAALCAGVITSGAVRVLCNLAAAWYSNKTHIYIHSWFHQGDGKVKSGRVALVALGPVVLMIIETRDAVAGQSLEAIVDARHMLETLCIASLLVELLQVICNAFTALINKNMDNYVSSFDHLNDRIPEKMPDNFGKIKVVLSCVAFCLPPFIDLMEHLGAERPEFYWFVLEFVCQATILSLIGAIGYDARHAYNATGKEGVYKYALKLIQSGFIQILLEAADEDDHTHGADGAPRQENEQRVEFEMAGVGMEERELAIGVGPDNDHSAMDGASPEDMAEEARIRIASGDHPLKSPPTAEMLKDERMIQLRAIQAQRREEAKPVTLMDTEGGKNFALSPVNSPTATEATLKQSSDVTLTDEEMK